MNKLLIGGAAAALVMGIGAASAQTPPPPGVAQGTAPLAAPARPMTPAPHARMTAMSDKVMTRAEVSAHVRAMFARLDTNRDGYLTREELNAGRARMAGMHGEMGAHGHHGGAAMPDRAAMFDRLDANHDGMISRQEYMAARPEVRERRMIVMRGGNAPEGAAMPGMKRMHMMMIGGMGERLFAQGDTNHDGRLSLAEAEAVALAHFDRADRNHDGRITPDERRQMHAEMHARHGG